jgi:CheY-like chemotaxis protein
MASRILLADDSITIQKVVNLTFADEGIEVVAVSNGEMAARRLDEVNPDLVLADIFMPGKNGYELCEAIKTNAKFCKVPVVLLVGAFEPFDQAEAKRVQADAHLTKPFESRMLVETVRKLLGKADRSRSEPLVSAPLTAPEPQTVQYEEPHELTTPAPVEAPVDASFSVNFESPSGEWTPVDMPANVAVGSTNGETLPIDLGDVSVGESLDFHSVEIQPSDEVISDVPAWERPTGELVSPPGYRESSIQTGSSQVHEPAAAATDSTFELPPSAIDQAVEAQRLEIETQSWPAATPSQAAIEQQQMDVDFQKSLPSNPATDSDVVMVDAIPPSSHVERMETRDSTEWHVEEVEQAATEWKAANSRNLKTTTLEMPESSQASMEATGETAGLFSFSETPAAAESSSLFTADEPLGDVLFDDATEPLPSAPSKSASPLDDPALTEFSLELTPDETASVEQLPKSHATSTRITGELVTAELPLEGQKLVEYAAQDFVGSEVFEQPREVLEQWADHEPQTTNSPEAVNLEWASLESASPESVHLESVSEEGPVAGAVAYDWTSPSAVAHSTGRLDAMVMPVEFTEPAAEGSAREAETQTSGAEAQVVEPVNWEAEQMGFAAIDIEASPAGEDDFSVQDFDSSDPERGFEISRALVDDQAVESHEDAHRKPSEAPHPPVELSPMVIDEIVRRVVAQIGDSVVREIAWEIVPDCVERIIDQQTREALARR